MKIKLYDVLDSESGLSKILNSTISLDFKTLYNVQKNLRLYRQETEDYQALLRRIIKHYGVEKDGNYEVDKFDKDQWSAFITEQRALLQTKIEAPFLALPESLIGLCSLTVEEQMSIAFLLWPEQYAETLTE